MWSGCLVSGGACGLCRWQWRAGDGCGQGLTRSHQLLAALECPEQRCSEGRAEGLVHRSRVLCSGGCGFNVGGNRDDGVDAGWRVGGPRWWCHHSEGDYPKSCAGAFVGAQYRAAAIRYGASNFGEGDIAAGVAERDDRNEGVGRQVGDDVGKASGRGEHGDVQRACVR